MNRNFWKDKKVFLTGHTGFKGSWLSLWLQDAGSIIKGYSLDSETKPNFFEAANIGYNMDSVIGDIRDLKNLEDNISSFCPEIVIHMAAQPLVRESYRNPVDTYSTNVMGTVNLLEACRMTPSIKAVINVTTDKCYENQEWLWGYRENEPMGGHDPYSNSKGCSELVTAAYRKSFFNNLESANLASARAGNVIGGGDWAEDRLIPDIINSFMESKTVSIRNPNATRPWQHVLEPLSGYLKLAEKLYTKNGNFDEGWNFGPNDDDVKPVLEIVEYMSSKWGKGASFQIDQTEQPHEAQLLKLDISKAISRLEWAPKWNLYKALDAILLWQKEYITGGDIKAISLQQIRDYELSK